MGLFHRNLCLAFPSITKSRHQLKEVQAPIFSVSNSHSEKLSMTLTNSSLTVGEALSWLLQPGIAESLGSRGRRKTPRVNETRKDTTALGLAASSTVESYRVPVAQGLSKPFDRILDKMPASSAGGSTKPSAPLQKRPGSTPDARDVL